MTGVPTEGLKSCPFCRADATLHEPTYSQWFGLCKSCGAQGPIENSEAKAASAWNRRSHRAGEGSDAVAVEQAAVERERVDVVCQLRSYANGAQWGRCVLPLKAVERAIAALTAPQGGDTREAAMQDCWNAVDDLVSDYPQETQPNIRGHIEARDAITALIDRERLTAPRESEDGWVKVSEKLPTDGLSTYHVTIEIRGAGPRYRSAFAHFNLKSKTWNQLPTTVRYHDFDVVAWRQLPPPFSAKASQGSKT